MAQDVSLQDRHRIVGTCIVYDHGPKFLILKRHPNLKVYPGLWTIPGGGMERNEYEVKEKNSPDGWENPLEEALRREIREEAGIEVGALQYLNNFTFVRPDDVPVFGLRFVAPYLSGTVTIDPEDSTEYAWISVSDLPKYEFLGDIPTQIYKVAQHL